MTREEIMELDLEQIEARSVELAGMIEGADASALDGIQIELDAMEERKKVIAEETKKRRKDVAAVIASTSVPIESEAKTMANIEVRNTQEYIDAFARYIKTGKDAECRALLSENVDGGTVPVPGFVEGRIRTAWENSRILSRVNRTYVRGNLRIGFEISAAEAQLHNEGAAAPAEEELELGIVTMVPQTIKKWITFSTEAAAMGSREFIDYIYDELTVRIIEKLESEIVSAIINAPSFSTSDAVGVMHVEAAAGANPTGLIYEAQIGIRSDATRPVVVASPQTIANIKQDALNANYAYDPFDGLEVIPFWGITDIIVGDLSGVQVNFPEGDNVRFVYDEYSLAERDLVKLVGRLYASVAVTRPDSFAVLSVVNEIPT